MSGVLVNTITPEEIQEICDMVQLEEEPKVDFKLFAGMAALAERILYPAHLWVKYLPVNSKFKYWSSGFMSDEPNFELSRQEMSCIAEKGDTFAMDFEFSGNSDFACWNKPPPTCCSCTSPKAFMISGLHAWWVLCSSRSLVQTFGPEFGEGLLKQSVFLKQPENKRSWQKKGTLLRLSHPPLPEKLRITKFWTAFGSF